MKRREFLRATAAGAVAVAAGSVGIIAAAPGGGYAYSVADVGASPVRRRYSFKDMRMFVNGVEIKPFEISDMDAIYYEPARRA